LLNSKGNAIMKDVPDAHKIADDKEQTPVTVKQTIHKKDPNINIT